jgi:hypothetical protein
MPIPSAEDAERKGVKVCRQMFVPFAAQPTNGTTIYKTTRPFCCGEEVYLDTDVSFPIRNIPFSFIFAIAVSLLKLTT